MSPTQMRFFLCFLLPLSAMIFSFLFIYEFFIESSCLSLVGSFASLKDTCTVITNSIQYPKSQVLLLGVAVVTIISTLYLLVMFVVKTIKRVSPIQVKRPYT